jgi:hypothetical protein
MYRTSATYFPLDTYRKYGLCIMRIPEESLAFFADSLTYGHDFLHYSTI